MTAGIGHNGVAADELHAFVERIEKLEAEKAELASDVREIYAEAKGSGFDAKILRKVIALRKKDPSERELEEFTLGRYKEALGMLATTPLGEAAVSREFA